jgi:hypothetical protein
MLIVAGAQGLLRGEHEHLWLDLLSIIVGVALLLAFKREYQRKGGHSHSRVGWFDVIAGVVIILEGVHKLHAHKWWQPGTLLMAVGAVTILIGFLHHRLPKLRRLICTESGFSIWARPFIRLSMPWSKIESVELVKNRLVVHRTGGGQRSIGLRRIENRAEVVEMLKEHLARHQVVDVSAP